MGSPPISVVIATYNRGTSLRDTLHALRYQTYRTFEVIVVNGPSNDSTGEVLRDFGDAIRIVEFSDRNASRARNLGIEIAAGDIVAFIDDDAIPEPTWLEELSLAYATQPDIGGAGGVVYDRSGVTLQYRYSAFDRIGRPVFGIDPPLTRFNERGANPFLMLPTCNASFRKDRLVEIGGFNEQMEIYNEDPEVCVRLIDRGYLLVALDGAPVHHRNMTNLRRDEDNTLIDPFSLVKNTYVFAYQNGLTVYSEYQVWRFLQSELERWRSHARQQFQRGHFGKDHFRRFLARLEEAEFVGQQQGRLPRPHRRFAPHQAHAFKLFPTHKEDGSPLRVCFISKQYPPEIGGGIGRFTADLARGFSDNGHEVHVISSQGTAHAVAYQQGVWLHRVPETLLATEELGSEAAHLDLSRIANVYREVLRSSRTRPFDVVSSPVWLAEGLLVATDPRFTSVISLHTTSKTLTEGMPRWASTAEAHARIILEELSAGAHAHTHANSAAALAKVAGEYGRLRDPFIIPHGVADRSNEFRRQRRDDGRLRVLVTGRLESRKGADILLDLMPVLLRRFPQLEFMLVGGASPIDRFEGRSLEEAYSEHYSREGDLLSRVIFAGVVPDDDLYQHYADADMFLYPGRYESFGLPVVEAMSFGLPVVACAAGGVAETVVDGENGVLVGVGDSQQLAEAISDLVVHPDKRQRFGRASRTRYLNHFALNVSVPRTIAAYRALADRDCVQARARDCVDFTIEALAERFAEVIVKASNCRGSDALRAARRLIGDGGPHRDFAAAVRANWPCSDREFVLRLYDLLHSRRLGRRELKAAVKQMRRIGGRGPMVRIVALASAARDVGTPTDWLPQLHEFSEEHAGTHYERNIRRPARRVLRKLKAMIKFVIDFLAERIEIRIVTAINREIADRTLTINKEIAEHTARLEELGLQVWKLHKMAGTAAKASQPREQGAIQGETLSFNDSEVQERSARSTDPEHRT